MPSQYSVDIPFSSSHLQQPFKLIELPPELQALVESDDSPTYVAPRSRPLIGRPPLILPSRLTITSFSPSPSAPAYALLSAGKKTYQMRQKNSSNPIMILKPSSTAPTPTDDPEIFIPAPSVCSIARIEDTIELIPQEPEKAEKAMSKVNKWHEKFAKSKVGK
jgi:sister chromatid cohesion protein DCC1